MKKFIIFGAVIIIFILILWGYSGRASPKLITVALVSQNQSSESGSPRGEAGQAILTEVEGQVKVELKMAGRAVDPQSASINRGRCDALGEAVYSLTPVTDSSSATTVTASFVALETNLPLAISVGNSCGDLALE